MPSVMTYQKPHCYGELDQGDDSNAVPVRNVPSRQRTQDADDFLGDVAVDQPAGEGVSPLG